METIKPDDLIVNSLTAFIKDVGNQYLLSRKDRKLDTEYLLKRFRTEGIGFVTKTLPAFGKHFDAALLAEKFASFPAFRRKRKSALPCFLYGLTRKVFDDNGTLRADSDPDAVRLVRQLSFLFYKLDLEYPQELVDDCIRNFVAVDEELTHCDNVTFGQAAYVFHAANLIERIFGTTDFEVLRPKPGPGQCATRTMHAKRFEPQFLFTKVHAVLPYYRYYYINSSHLLSSVHRYRNLPKRDESISRLAIVPKDSRGPRIICMEPPEFMWFQQGIKQIMVDTLEQHPLTRGHVNFTDQTINGKLALRASLSGNYATLDMKEASDRVSKSLVDLLFDQVPKLRDKLLALSTDYIEMPNGSLLASRKFAPMGSALCFPVMSVVHYALAVATIMVDHSLSEAKARRHVFVYGDDLIVTSKFANAMFGSFPLFGLMFNQAKSCYTGQFRESCGIDAFKGVDVTPLRIKRSAISKKDASSLSSWFAYHHGLWKRGLWHMAETIRSLIEAIAGKFPCKSESSSVLGWTTSLHQTSAYVRTQIGLPPEQPEGRITLARCRAGVRWNWKTQSHELKVRKSVSARPFASMIGCWERLLRAQLVIVEGSSAPLTKREYAKTAYSWIPLSAF